MAGDFYFKAGPPPPETAADAGTDTGGKTGGETPPPPTATPALPLRGFEFEVVALHPDGTERERRKGRARLFAEELPGGVQLEMVEILGGTFRMGTAASEADKVKEECKRYLADDEKHLADAWIKWEAPQHLVSVPSFFRGKGGVTQAQWRAVAGLPKVSRDLLSDPAVFKGGDRPVEKVSWEEAVEFCERLSRATGRTYRLPTEAEWEYACRAGTETPFHFGDTITAEVVNYAGKYPYGQAPKGVFRRQTTAVASLGAANAFGLFDMHGNVWEWCLDPWHENYDGAPTDGGPWEANGNKDYRVVRGGGWVGSGYNCRAALRRRLAPTARSFLIGIRVVLVVRAR